MSIFAITFRIHEDAGYAERYDSVTEAIKKVCHGPHWSEPTSFILFENPSSSEKIAEYIDENSKFAPSKDLLLVINLSKTAYKAIGVVRDDDLHVLMKKR